MATSVMTPGAGAVVVPPTREDFALTRESVIEKGPVDAGIAALHDAGSPAVRVGSVALLGRRVFDVVIAATALALLCIPMLLIAVVVATTSRGGALFAQRRVGRGGKPITVFKFRSMCDGADELLHADEDLRAEYLANDFKLDGAVDPRITPVGRILRKTSLDELPQLWNVIRGDMSIVGIRPLLFEELALRPKVDQDLYESLRPGMTGLWQVRGRSNVEQADRIALDREYVQNWSIWNDVKILCRTPLAVLRTRETH